MPSTPQVRVQNRTLEQIVGVPVPQIKEDGLQLVSERVQNRTLEQIVDVPVPQIEEDGLQVVPERLQNRTLEQIVDVSVPQIKEAIVAGVEHAPRTSRGSDRVCASARMLWTVFTSYHRSCGKSGSSWTGQEDPLRSRTLGRSSAPGKFSL